MYGASGARGRELGQTSIDSKRWARRNRLDRPGALLRVQRFTLVMAGLFTQRNRNSCATNQPIHAP
eukprot:11491119-Alexandrium_andersonii.AAC.1